MKGKIKNLKIKATSVGLAAMLSIVGTLAGCSKNIEKKVETEESSTSYSAEVSTEAAVISTEDPVMLDVGNCKYQGPVFRDLRIKHLNKKNIPVGLIISTEASNESDIYNDVEYVKSLMTEHTIDFPVYLNIEEIVKNQKLNPEDKEKLILTFLEKCADNGMYVGIYGSDETLCKAYSKFSDELKFYDAFVLSDDDNRIKYPGPYNMYQTADGEIHTNGNINLNKIIKEKNLNNAEKFVNDVKYTVKKDDSLDDIAYAANMSVEALLRYNNVKAKNVEEGTVLIIPSKQQRTLDTLDKFVTKDGFIRGCDISFHQKGRVDWEKIRDNFGFVIIKTGNGVTVDECFSDHYRAAEENGMEIGVYRYNMYSAKDGDSNLETFKADQQEQANKTLELLEDKKISYPVYLDVEQFSSPWAKYMPIEYATTMINTWCDTISSGGYIPGFYSNGVGYDYFSSLVENVESKSSKTTEEEAFVNNWNNKIQKWVAGGPQYNPEKLYELEDVKTPSAERLENYGDVDMFQVTSSATNAGVSNDQGQVDVNFSSVDYGTGEKMEKYNTEPEIKEIKDNSNRVITLSIPLVGGAIAFGTVSLSSLKKPKTKIKSKRR